MSTRQWRSCIAMVCPKRPFSNQKQTGITGSTCSTNLLGCFGQNECILWHKQKTITLESMVFPYLHQCGIVRPADFLCTPQPKSYGLIQTRDSKKRIWWDTESTEYIIHCIFHMWINLWTSTERRLSYGILNVVTCWMKPWTYGELLERSDIQSIKAPFLKGISRGWVIHHETSRKTTSMFTTAGMLSNTRSVYLGYAKWRYLWYIFKPCSIHKCQNHCNILLCGRTVFA